MKDQDWFWIQSPSFCTSKIHTFYSHYAQKLHAKGILNPLSISKRSKNKMQFNMVIETILRYLFGPFWMQLPYKICQYVLSIMLLILATCITIHPWMKKKCQHNLWRSKKVGRCISIKTICAQDEPTRNKRVNQTIGRLLQHAQCFWFGNSTYQNDC